ncbi:uncharacterized protein HaLaN_07893 [Haematococcus lacustris]|uniref:U1-C C2H2-type zinc finger domain-containing protein n=1 Tax=Haematococcus lacustris TaxID=44745 RepID=A0A699YXK1_HAELA|nr:uncharacterized protein HaLaN_07893 [Haematococcus lacustris]
MGAVLLLPGCLCLQPAVRKQHNSGYKHKANVRNYYCIFDEVMEQREMDRRMAGGPMGGMPPGMPRPMGPGMPMMGPGGPFPGRPPYPGLMGPPGMMRPPFPGPRPYMGPGPVFNVHVVKGGHALVFECESDGTFMAINHVSHEPKDGDVPDSAYTGPVFEELDEALQGHFREFLAERGISIDLGEYLRHLVYDKEQREYMAWLNRVAEFVAKK